MKNKHGLLTLTIATGLFVYSTTTYANTYNDLIITPNQIFLSCEAANRFRTQQLPQLIEYEEKRKKQGVQDRYRSLKKEYEERAKRLKTELAAAKRDKWEAISQKAALEVAYSLLGGVKDIGKTQNISDKDLEILEKVANKAKNMERQVREKIIGDNTFNLQEFALDIVIDNADLLLTVMGSTPYFAQAIKTIQAAKTGIDFGFIYYEKDKAIDFKKAELDIVVQALENFYDKSPKARLADLNNTKRIIRDACVTGALSNMH